MELMETKVCRVCKIEKELHENFTLSKRYNTDKNGEKKLYVVPLTICRECNKIKSKEYHKRNKSSINSDIRVLDTMIEIYQERGLKDITEAFKVIGKAELKRLAHERLNK